MRAFVAARGCGLLVVCWWWSWSWSWWFAGGLLVVMLVLVLAVVGGGCYCGGSVHSRVCGWGGGVE